VFVGTTLGVAGSVMAQLWQRDRDGWACAPLDEEAVSLLTDRGPAIANGDGCPADSVLLLRTASGQWMLLCGQQAELRVNGTRPLTQIAALEDRDEVVLLSPEGNCRRQYFFSTERLARVEPFPGAAGPFECARCGQPLEKDDAAVQCPACGSWHHAMQSLPCWQYNEHCAVCDQPTDLEAGYRWVPEEV